MKIKYLLFFVAILFSGCATVNSNVNIYHQGNIQLKGKTYAFMPIKKLGQNKDLQYDYFSKIISRHLNNYGMKEVPIKRAHLIVRFTYGNYDSYGPYLEHTAYASTQELAGFGNTSFRLSPHGITYTEIFSDTLFPYAFVMLIYKASDIKKGVYKPIYQVIVGSTTDTGESNKMYSYLIDAAFKNFPGESGSSKTTSRIMLS